MSKWYYVREGQQGGPVYQAELKGMVATGRLEPSALVWREGMGQWQPISSIPELTPASAAAPRMAPATKDEVPGMPALTTSVPAGKPTGVNPYSTPDISAGPIAIPGSPSRWKEIAPGSEPIKVGPCLSRAFELTKRHFGGLLLIGLISVSIVFAVQVVLGFGQAAVGFMTGEYDLTKPTAPAADYAVSRPMIAYLFFSNLTSQLVTLFLSLGITRIGLNLVSGKAFHPGMMFGEGSKLARAFAASIVYGLMVGVGLLLLVIPGIHLAIRFGHYQNAIVDRDLGVFEALAYSSSITTHSRLSLFGLLILSLLIVLAGLLAFVVGLAFALPVVWLASLIAYRWMQHGSVVTQDPRA